MTMASLAIPWLTPTRSPDFKSSIYPSVRATCCTTDTSRSIGCYFFNYHSMRIEGVAFKQKQLVPRKCLVAKALIGEKSRSRETVVPDPDYRIPVILLGLSGALICSDNLLLAAPIGLLGLLLLFQTTRVRFVFDDEALEVRVGDELDESGENVFVGGKNRWKYSTFVNWELWWPNFPILVYFKETQTKPEGQVHFFPVIFNGKQLYDAMVERAGPSKNSGPK